MKWGGAMKFLSSAASFQRPVTPLGLAQTEFLWDVLLSIPVILFKIFLVLVLVAESSSPSCGLFALRNFPCAAFATAQAFAMITRLPVDLGGVSMLDLTMMATAGQS